MFTIDLRWVEEMTGFGFMGQFWLVFEPFTIFAVHSCASFRFLDYEPHVLKTVCSILPVTGCIAQPQGV